MKIPTFYDEELFPLSADKGKCLSAMKDILWVLVGSNGSPDCFEE